MTGDGRLAKPRLRDALIWRRCDGDPAPLTRALRHVGKAGGLLISLEKGRGGAGSAHVVHPTPAVNRAAAMRLSPTPSLPPLRNEAIVWGRATRCMRRPQSTPNWKRVSPNACMRRRTDRSLVRAGVGERRSADRESEEFDCARRDGHWRKEGQPARPHRTIAV